MGDTVGPKSVEHGATATPACQRRFPDSPTPLTPERVERRRGLHLDARSCGISAADTMRVVGEVGGARHAIFIVDHLLVERCGDREAKAAVHLALGHLWLQNRPCIVDHRPANGPRPCRFRCRLRPRRRRPRTRTSTGGRLNVWTADDRRRVRPSRVTRAGVPATKNPTACRTRCRPRPLRAGSAARAWRPRSMAAARRRRTPTHRAGPSASRSCRRRTATKSVSLATPSPLLGVDAELVGDDAANVVSWHWPCGRCADDQRDTPSRRSITVRSTLLAAAGRFDGAAHADTQLNRVHQRRAGRPARHADSSYPAASMQRSSASS